MESSNGGQSDNEYEGIVKIRDGRSKKDTASEREQRNHLSQGVDLETPHVRIKHVK